MEIKTESTKLQELENWIRNNKKIIVAYSGGIDSSLVLYLSRKILGKNNAIGFTARSASHKITELEKARAFCESYDITLEEFDSKEFDDEEYIKNTKDRCYICKRYIFNGIIELTKKYPKYTIATGTNLDDMGDYRPGNKAANELNITAPLMECGISKSELRQIAKHYGLPNWDKPATPCLSTRIPYNDNITLKKLKQIEDAEYILNKFGFIDVRVRHYNDFARIEVPKDDLPKLEANKKEILTLITDLGFERCEIDPEGFVSGKLNKAINKRF